MQDSAGNYGEVLINALIAQMGSGASLLISSELGSVEILAVKTAESEQ